MTDDERIRQAAHELLRALAFDNAECDKEHDAWCNIVVAALAAAKAEEARDIASVVSAYVNRRIGQASGACAVAALEPVVEAAHTLAGIILERANG